VLADANQLEMALLNLTVNARDAMPDGGEIVIATREENIRPGNSRGLEPGLYMCLSVSDTGAGMDEETLRRAAEPFFTTKGVGKGTGLGLSMVQGMAEQSGGSFTIKSRPGEGTTVELRLPLAKMPAQPVSAGPRAASEAAVRQNPLVVLAVDDDFLVLTNTIAMLEDLGHTAIEADSGEEALAILKERTVDLVITDQAMPNMTGAQLAEAIKSEWPDLPVILATGYAELEPGFAAGLPRLSKPFDERDLAVEIAKIAAPAAARVLQFRTSPKG
jgi:CheY-like chemotaxis protein